MTSMPCNLIDEASARTKIGGRWQVGEPLSLPLSGAFRRSSPSSSALFYLHWPAQRIADMIHICSKRKKAVAWLEEKKVADAHQLGDLSRHFPFLFTLIAFCSMNKSKEAWNIRISSTASGWCGVFIHMYFAWRSGVCVLRVGLYIVGYRRKGKASLSDVRRSCKRIIVTENQLVFS